ncbi:MAG: Asp-tRNA(Asn)/Glu-tRNA(Gln) amidotransferase subunit GatB [Candidatus Spechtbacterales bacterium]
MKYEPTIGLEIHAQLKTKTKLFCDSLNDSFEAHPNINICPVCMGHPGVLPVTNLKAVEHIVRVGMALGSDIAEKSKFDRKNYFYPDLPKGYQISQYDMPFCSGGFIDIETEEGKKRIEVERVHLEEDTGRLVHSGELPGEDASLKGKHSYVDFNRAGVPLMELVTKPVIKSATEARKFAEELRSILKYLEASDADMEKGQMRVEVNLSLAPAGSEELGTKVELKNLNSLRVVQDASAYEIERQSQLLSKGKKVIQETRGWDEEKQKTFSQRTKEEAHDYRYFPEPDIPPVVLSKQYGFDLPVIKASLPELPQAKRKRFQEQYGLLLSDIEVLAREKDMADYYENAVSEATRWSKDKNLEETQVSKITANYIVKNLRTLLTESATPLAELKISPEDFGEFITLVMSGDISSAAARDVLAEMFTTGKDPSQTIDEKGLKQVSGEAELTIVVEQVITENEKAVEDYKNGEESALKFLIGQVMAKSKGSANPQIAQEILKKLIKKYDSFL